MIDLPQTVQEIHLFVANLLWLHLDSSIIVF